ncbi:MAG: histidinol-phosphatase HisJ family protein [Lachnospiraceae bacterium]|nr:histidinol-phosphatase HisJ family protein [Lachnospiraceae bacterium]
MITADFHTHTSFSTDSKSSPESMIESAIARGLKTYCITDHMDYFFPEHNDKGFTEFVFDPDLYFETLTALRSKYRGKIDLRIGIELGLRDEPDVREKNKALCDALINSYPFDFVIGSTHVIAHFDPYYRERWNGRSAEEIVRMYFESILYSVRHYDCFHVYGHLDYILRYVPDGAALDMAQYDELIDTILKELIARGKGIEVNTGWLIKGGPSVNPSRAILEKYYAFGGRIITIGSDSHIPERIGGRFDDAVKLLKEIGFKEYSVFRKGKESRRKL